MPYGTPVLLKRMPLLGGITDAPPIGDQPTMGVTAPQSQMVEGAVVAFNIDRAFNIRGECSVTWTVTSDAGAADFTGPTTNTAYFIDGQTSSSVSVQTVRRAGDQGSRTLRCQLSAPVGGILNPNRPFASVSLADYIEPDPELKWWKKLPLRSQNAWASGPSDFGPSIPNVVSGWKLYDAYCAYTDAFNGSCHGGPPGYSRITTWDKCAGGPSGNPSVIDSTGQFAWTSATGGMFSSAFQEVPPNNAWVIFEFIPIPYNVLYTGTTIPDSVLDALAGTTYNQRFKDMGGRINKLFTDRGISLEWFVGRMFVEPNGGFWYNFPATSKTKWLAAINNIIAQIRIGAGNYPLKFLHCPRKTKVVTGLGDYGTLESWYPANCDGIAMTYHPASGASNYTNYRKQMDGDSSWYGLEDDALKLATDKDVAFALIDWSPQYEDNPIADSIYQWTFDELLAPNARQILADCVHDKRTFYQSGADDQPTQTPAGKAAWARGAVLFPTLWGGTKPAIQPPPEPTPPTAWWNFTGLKGNRKDGRRCGISYFGDQSQLPSSMADYNKRIGWADAFNGHHGTDAMGRQDTMRLLTGGTYGTIAVPVFNDVIESGSYMDWNQNSNWTAVWELAPSYALICWTMNTTSVDKATWRDAPKVEGVDYDEDAIWDEVNNGDWDQAYINWGARFARQIRDNNPKNHPAGRIFLRLNHENNQTNNNRVYKHTKARYKLATERFITKFRQGLGMGRGAGMGYNATDGTGVHFVHAPAHNTQSGPQAKYTDSYCDLGDFLSWCPDNCDVLSASWHPSTQHDDDASLANYCDQTNSTLVYSCKSVYDAAKSVAGNGRPVCWPEWSPKNVKHANGTYECCPRADIAYQKFNQYIHDNVSITVFDTVFEWNAIQANGYEDKRDTPASAAGRLGWSNGCAYYKGDNQWGGDKQPA